MKNRSLIVLSFLLLSAPALAETKCKANALKNPIRVEYTNERLDERGQDNFETDCVPMIEEMLTSEMLPEVDGIRVPVRLVYSLTNDELFPTISRLLAAARGGLLKLEIRFSIGEDDAPGEMTSFQLDASDRPPPLGARE